MDNLNRRKRLQWLTLSKTWDITEPLYILHPSVSLTVLTRRKVKEIIRNLKPSHPTGVSWQSFMWVNLYELEWNTKSESLLVVVWVSIELPLWLFCRFLYVYDVLLRSLVESCLGVRHYINDVWINLACLLIFKPCGCAEQLIEVFSNFQWFPVLTRERWEGVKKSVLTCSK